MDKVSVSALMIYPVKSCAGISLERSELDSMGLKYDRRWMLVSPDGKFLSQRTLPEMALIKTALDEQGGLTLSMQGKDHLQVPAADDKTITVKIWNDTVEANLVSDACDNWISGALGVACRLVYIADDVVRQCDLAYAKRGDRTGFSDGFPMLLISQASLDDLNQRLTARSVEPVEMRRFRPNIVVSGCQPYAEDTWQDFSIAGIPMRGVKPCSRCPIPTVNPDTGERTGTEPIATLSTYRKQGAKVFFGMNVIQQKTGVLKLGDELHVK
jgi:uncharacterized protein YcbX